MVATTNGKRNSSRNGLAGRATKPCTVSSKMTLPLAPRSRLIAATDEGRIGVAPESLIGNDVGVGQHPDGVDCRWTISPISMPSGAAMIGRSGCPWMSWIG